MAMRLREKEALEFLASNGCKIKRAQFYRIKAKLSSLRRKISDTDTKVFNDLILRTQIQQIETITYMSFQNARNEKDPFKNQKILESIIRMLPYVTAYYEELTFTKTNPHLLEGQNPKMNSFVEELADY